MFSNRNVTYLDISDLVLEFWHTAQLSYKYIAVHVL